MTDSDRWDAPGIGDEPEEVGAPRLRVVEPAGGCDEWSQVRGLRWVQGRDGVSRVVKSPRSLALILSHHPEWQGLAWDEFAGAAVLRERPTLDGQPPPRLGPVDDYVEHYARCWLSERAGVDWPATDVAVAIVSAAKARPFHPVREYLRGLQWDGTPRIGSWLSDYCAAERTEAHGVMGRKWLISAVARVMSPGCQADNLLVLEGEQGVGKTSALRWALLPHPEWFLPSVPDLSSKDAQQALGGIWIACLDELKALLSLKTSEIAKNYLTECIDTYRPPYGHHFVKRPRQCVFIATTNSDEYLTDPTGNRRFWPVRVGLIDRDALTRDRDQLWAEALYAYENSQEPETWWLSREEQLMVDDLTELRSQHDEWESRVADWLAGKTVCTLEGVLHSAIGFEGSAKWTRRDQMRAAAVLRTLGWIRHRAGPRGARRWEYRREEKWQDDGAGTDVDGWR
jgi:putative DNA primase/helicase